MDEGRRTHQVGGFFVHGNYSGVGESLSFVDPDSRSCFVEGRVFQGWMACIRLTFNTPAPIVSPKEYMISLPCRAVFSRKEFPENTRMGNSLSSLGHKPDYGSRIRTENFWVLCYPRGVYPECIDGFYTGPTPPYSRGNGIRIAST